MVEAQPQFTPKQILEAGQRAVAEGRIEYARQFFQHLIDHYADTAEAASARAEIMGLAHAATTAAPPLASNAPDLRIARPSGPPPDSQRRRNPPPSAPLPTGPRPARPDWAHDPRAEPTFDRHGPREPLPPFAADRPVDRPADRPVARRPVEPAVTPPPLSRALAPAPEKHYIAGRVFTGLIGFFGFLGLPLGIVMLYGVVADPSLFETLGITKFAGALWASLAVFFASIGLILVSQMARAVFDAADAAGDLVRLERYRLGLDDDDD